MGSTNRLIFLTFCFNGGIDTIRRIITFPMIFIIVFDI